MADILPVVLSGGAGTRLWPLSRADLPKQLLPLPGPKTMLQATVERVDCLSAQPSRLVVVANAAHLGLIESQLESIGQEADIILEPVGRNTAPAVALAAELAVRTGRASDLLLVMPADHVIANPKRFASAVQRGVDAAHAGALVTFGIVPTEPHTGYGYIRAGSSADDVAPVEAFVEKPDLETATRYLATGEYFWNAGIFLFRADAYLAELAEHAADIADAVAASVAVMRERGVVSPDRAAFSAVRSESIDYAVMEKTARARVVALDAGWSDVGSWSALCDVSERDGDGNTLRGRVIAESTTNSGIFAESRTVAVIGLSDTIVVETPDSVLVTSRDACQDVKTAVATLRSQNDPIAERHSQQRFPWGTLERLDRDAAPDFWLLRLAPHARCSLGVRAQGQLIGTAGSLRLSGSITSADVAPGFTHVFADDERLTASNPNDEWAAILVRQIHVDDGAVSTD
ncbi:MAG: mannose-1-phosphate guanylyltransferase/mannose-6-phosphate isomerase [Pseudomonadota bacterium]